MGSLLQKYLAVPFVEEILTRNAWAWPLTEVTHFIGIILLVGIVAMFDLRLLGLAKRLPIAPLRALLPWAVFGSVLAFGSGLVFVTGVRANVSIHPYTILMNNIWLQLKLLFLGLAGLNLLAFYLTGMSRAVDQVGAGQDAPPLARLIGGISLVLWICIMYFGRVIVWGKFTP